MLSKINEIFIDETNRPKINIRILHTFVLDDPFEDTEDILALIPMESPV